VHARAVAACPGKLWAQVDSGVDGRHCSPFIARLFAASGIDRPPAPQISKEEDFEAILRQEEEFISKVSEGARARSESEREPPVVHVGLSDAAAASRAAASDRSHRRPAYAPHPSVPPQVCGDIIALKPDVVITEKGVSDLASHFFVKAGITAIRRVRKTDNNRIGRVCGATIVSRTDELQESDVGTRCGLMEIRKFGDEYFMFLGAWRREGAEPERAHARRGDVWIWASVLPRPRRTGFTRAPHSHRFPHARPALPAPAEKCEKPQACTILLRGGSKDVLMEFERNLQDAMQVARNIIFEPKLLPGGGATEMSLSTALIEKSKTVEGIEAWPFRAMASALEVIPRTLAQNCGADTVRLLTELRASKANGANPGLGEWWGWRRRRRRRPKAEARAGAGADVRASTRCSHPFPHAIPHLPPRAHTQASTASAAPSPT
jgi:chaperonin GroEL (HSP60 family)